MKAILVIAIILALSGCASNGGHFATNEVGAPLGKPLRIYVLPKEQVREKCKSIVANARGCWRRTATHNVIWVPPPSGKRDMCTWGHELMHAHYGTFHDPDDWGC